MVWCYTGPMEQAEATFKPIRETFPPALDFVGPMPYPALQSMFDPLYPSGLQWYWKADFVNELSDEAIERYVRPRFPAADMAVDHAPLPDKRRGAPGGQERHGV